MNLLPLLILDVHFSFVVRERSEGRMEELGGLSSF